MKKRILLLLLALVLLMAGCGAEQEEVPQVQPTPEQTVMEDNDVFGDYMASIEAQSEAIKTSLEQDALTQADMNMKSQELYELWDGALNYLWGELKNRLPEAEFAKLLDEQLNWIEEKEQAAEEAGKPYEGGSIYPLIVNSEAAAITEKRVYELYELLTMS